MKKTLAAVGLLLGVAAVLYFVIVNFSVITTKYECRGTLMANGADGPVTAFFRLEDYRWWVHLWSDSDGALWLEMPQHGADYYSKISTEGKDSVVIQRKPGEISGKFSRLSEHLWLTTAYGLLEGDCSKKP
jgi:hypothetical protein